MLVLSLRDDLHYYSAEYSLVWTVFADTIGMKTTIVEILLVLGNEKSPDVLQPDLFPEYLTGIY